MHVKFGALSISMAMCLMAGVSFGASTMQWQPTLERAQVVAAHSNRLVLVHFWGNGCPPCAWMDREVFTRPDVADAIDRGFVAVRINKDQFPNVASQFGVAAVPADVIITPQGQVLGSYVGKASVPEYLNRLAQVAQRAAPPTASGYANQTFGQPGQQPATAQAYGYQIPVAQAQGPQSYPGYSMGGYGNGGSSPVPSFQQQAVQPGQTVLAHPAPRYSEQLGVAGPDVARTPPGGPPTTPFEMNRQQDTAVAMGPASYSTDSYSPRSQVPPADPMVSQPGFAPQAPAQQPAAVPGQGNPPLALDGFCPVSLERTMRLDPQPKWIPGDSRWGARHEGRTYLFAGLEEQQVFLNNPNYFAPVLSGNDAVTRVEQGRQVPGVREFGARWRDRVYLFSNRENYEKFQANPEFYESQVLALQQTATTFQQKPGQQVGGRMNSPYQYR